MTNKSKLTLIVDGNWLLMSRLAVISGRYPDTYELNRELKLLMIRSINLVLRTFPVIDNIIFVADGGSWRNTEVPVPLFLQNDGIEYKGNREHSDDIDWDVIFTGYEDFLNVLKDNGVTVSKEKMIEGDDWCWWWSTYLNSQGTNVIIWSKDRDLTQLVNTDNNGCFTVCWNKDLGITCMDKDEDEFNFLFNNEFSENDKLFQTISNKSIAVNRINPSEVCIDKIIRGDLGDNIQPIIVKKPKNENSTRVYKVSQKDIDNSLNVFDENNKSCRIINLTDEGKSAVFTLLGIAYKWEAKFFENYTLEKEKGHHSIVDSKLKTIEELLYHFHQIVLELLELTFVEYKMFYMVLKYPLP